MEFTGTATSYKCIANKGSKISFASISQAVSDESYLFPNRQYNSLVLSCEDGRNQKQVFSRISKRNLEVFPTPWDKNYCRMSFKFHKRGGRLTVKKLKKPFRVETASRNISEILSDHRKTRNGFLLLGCQYNFHLTLHGNQVHTVRERMQCSKYCSISIFMLFHLFQ